MTRLVVIHTKTNDHIAYNGRNVEARAQFTRCLTPGEIEVFRTNPHVFLDNIDMVAEEQVVCGDAA